MYIKELFLPKLPDNIINEVYQSIDQGSNRMWSDKELIDKPSTFDMYHWVPINDTVQNWCKSNISPDLYWGVQIIDNNLPMHKDHGTEIKFNYIIDQGNVDAKTNYYDDDGVLLKSYILIPHTWYILNVTINHSMTGINPGEKRISITSRIMP